VIAAVVLAAGAGRRYGGAKQLHPVDGRPMLERVLQAVAAGPVDDRVLVLGARADQVLDAIDLHGARVVRAVDWESGQSASLRAGLAALDAAVRAALVVLGDGPGLDPRALRRMVDAGRARPETVLAADYGDGRSHPVLLPRAVWSDLPAEGETPGRALPAELVDCRGLGRPGDVDYAAE
jgi:molybdenum cofactor cytidylyltransferase